LVFSSHIFVLYFLPLTLLVYYLARGSWRLIVLLIFSFAFYAWANPWFVCLLAWSTLVDFCCGNFIGGYWQLGRRPPESETKITAPTWQKNLFLLLSLCSNIGLLLVFKYFAFAESNLNAMRAALGLEPYRILHIILPVGISFYTFESLSYVIDIYRGVSNPASVMARKIWPDLKPVEVELRALLTFACYLSQFPHLVAGPIIRFQQLEDQMYHRRHTLEKFAKGVVFVCLGFAKKILIADTMGEVADWAFNGHPTVWIDAWFGLLGYAFQIYYDFSGYSDMAIGLGLLFGFEFAKNFDAPYKSASITEFWRRWHISLSNWLRDYLYIGLGGNRRGQMRTYLNLMVVMLVGGLWHGASWSFAIWGGIHGSWLALERVAGRRSFYNSAPRVLRVAITFLIVCIAWVFFRAADLPAALAYCKLLFSFQLDVTPVIKIAHLSLWTPVHIVGIFLAAMIAFFGVQTWDLARRVTPATAAFSLLVFWGAMLTLSVRSYSPFIYFRF
jgi:alginate O-acetyltransferase complex protein AlgI